MVDTGVKVGVMFGFTTIVIVVVVAHCPAAGVNVYVVVAVLLTAGDHVPLMPSFEIGSNAAKAAPEQIGATWVNVGVILGLTTIVIVVPFAHCAAEGAKTYVVVTVLLTVDGDQVPLMPSFEDKGSELPVDPEQIGPTAVKVGVTFGVIVTVNVVVVAH
jgi:hypothetical protein